MYDWHLIVLHKKIKGRLVVKSKVSKAVWFETNEVAIVFYSLSMCQGPARELIMACANGRNAYQPVQKSWQWVTKSTGQQYDFTCVNFAYHKQ